MPCLAGKQYRKPGPFLMKPLMPDHEPSELLLFVDQHPTTVVADLWQVMNTAPRVGEHGHFDQIAENLLRVLLCDGVPEPLQTAARDFCKAYTACTLRNLFNDRTLTAPQLH